MTTLRCTSETHVEIPELKVTVEPNQELQVPAALAPILVARGGFEFV